MSASVLTSGSVERSSCMVDFAAASVVFWIREYVSNVVVSVVVEVV